MKKKVLGCGIAIAVLSLLGVVLLRFHPLWDTGSAGDGLDRDAAQAAGKADDDAGSEGLRYLMLKEEDFNTEERGMFSLYFEEESFIYSVSSNQEEFPHYYRYYFDSGEKVFLGEIPDHFTGLKNGETRLGDGIYFFALLKGEGKRSALFCIDLNENTVKRCCEYDDGSVPANVARGYQEEVVTLKTIKREDNSVRSFLAFYHPVKDEWAERKNELWQRDQESGVYMSAFYAFKDKLYVLQSEYGGKRGGETKRLILYDGNMNQVKDYVLREGIDRSTSRMGIGSELSINGKLVYVKDSMNYGYLGIMREDKIETIMELEEELIKVYGESRKYGDGALFFRRGADILYRFDQETEQLLQVSLSLNEGETLKRVFVDGDYIMLDCYAEDENGNNLRDRLYVMPIDSIFL